MPPRRELFHRATSSTLVSVDFSASGSEDVADEVDLSPKWHLPSPRIHDTLDQSDHLRIHETFVPDGENKATWRAKTQDTIFLASIFVMLVWPWIFLLVIWSRKGVQASNNVAKIVMENSQRTSFVATFLGNIVSLIVSMLFSFTIVRYAQERITSNKDFTVFQVILLSGLRHQHWPWRMKDLNREFIRARWLPSIGILFCIAAFASLPSGTTSLITPVPFNRNTSLTGTELDFSSNATDCLAWYKANPLPNNCDWLIFNNMHYTDCLGENQLVDVLEAGRASILSLIRNNSQSLTLSQLGAQDGMNFLGPIRGVLPIGPNGVPAFNTLKTSPLNQTTGMISYNYTLDHQGLASNVSCIYDTQSPIISTAIPYANNSLMISSNGSCTDGLAEFLGESGLKQFPTLNTNNTLTFWSCKSVPTGEEQPTYYVYLRGHAHYKPAIGNITCAVTPIQPALFPVVYQSGPGIFSTKNSTKTFASFFPGFIESVLVALGSVVWESQNSQDNLVAESVITLGVKSFNLPPYNQSEEYLRLYEAMLRGIIEYETSYARLIYSTLPGRPQSCNRTVTGSVSYKVIGWNPTRENGYFLIPMSALNLASLIVLLRTIFKGKRHDYQFDPLDPSSLLLASPNGEKGHIEWEDIVKYRREARKKIGSKFVDDTKNPLSEYLVEGFSG